VNVGCVPKKVMWNTAMHAELIHDHKEYGFDVEMKGFNWGFVHDILLSVVPPNLQNKSQNSFIIQYLQWKLYCSIFYKSFS